MNVFKRSLTIQKSKVNDNPVRMGKQSIAAMHDPERKTEQSDGGVNFETLFDNSKS